MSMIEEASERLRSLDIFKDLDITADSLAVREVEKVCDLLRFIADRTPPERTIESLRDVIRGPSFYLPISGTCIPARPGESFSSVDFSRLIANGLEDIESLAPSGDIKLKTAVLAMQEKFAETKAVTLDDLIILKDASDWQDPEMAEVLFELLQAVEGKLLQTWM